MRNTISFHCLFLAAMLLLSLGLATPARAQSSAIPVCKEIAQVENGDGDIILEVLDMPEHATSHYWLNVGNLGIGDDVIQVFVDPLFKLYIPLGNTLQESLQTLADMQSLFKAAPGSDLQTTGNLSPTFPKDNLEPVRVVYRKLLISKMLEFSVTREGYTRATSVQRSDFNSLVSSLKFYKKLHKKLQ